MMYGCGSSVLPKPKPTDGLTVLSPNGGETWAKGTVQTIKWNDIVPASSCTSSSSDFLSCYEEIIAKLYDIWLMVEGCSDPRVACAVAPQLIVKSYAGMSLNYNWTPNVTGSYKVLVCGAGSFNSCDSSNSHFKIVEAVSTSQAESSYAAIGSQLDSISKILQQLTQSISE